MFALVVIWAAELIENMWIPFKLFSSSLLLLLTITICIYLIRRLPRIGSNFFDPGFVFVIYIGSVVIPVALIALFDFELIQLKYYNRFVDIDIFSKTLLAHVVFIVSFSSSYMILSLNYKSHYQDHFNKFTINKIWPVLACLGLLFHIFIQYYYGFFSVNPWFHGGTQVLGHKVRSIGQLSGQIYQKIALLENCLLIFGIGVVAARSSSIKIARIKLITILLIYFAFKFFFTTERGIILIIGLGAASYADIVRWNGELLTRRLVILGLIFGFGFNILTSIIEHIVQYGILGVSDITDIFTIRGGVASAWITSIIISRIDNLNMPLQHGQNYVNAIMSILPSQFYNKPIMTLSNWFANWYIPQRSELGIGYGFSPIAEGYLNASMLGVFIHGFFIGVLASVIRYLQFGKKFKVYGAFFFSVLFSGFYKLYHVGSVNILKSFQWKIIFTAFLIIIGYIIITSSKDTTIR